MEDLKKNRFFLKSTNRKGAALSISDQRKGITEPAKEKSITTNTEFIELIDPHFFKLGNKPTKETIQNRRSHRTFSETSLTLEELSYLTWASQGLRNKSQKNFRTVPSAGARHSFETYLYINKVENLMEGFYRYLPMEHKLAFLFTRSDSPARLTHACLGQKFVGTAAATFIWTTIPYRTEWRYPETAYKVIALDAGHVCQNLYLACESIDAGTCAIAAYDQEEMDSLLELDGEDEFVIYLAPVGKVN